MAKTKKKQRFETNKSYRPAKLKPSGLCSRCDKKCEVYTQTYARIIECVYK